MGDMIRLNGMLAHSPFILTPDVWGHPRDNSIHHNTLAYWMDMARLFERGKFDGLFLADTFGIFDVYKSSAETAIKYALRVPLHDPVLTIPAMASVTEHLGFGVTQNISYEHPYLLARRMGTLDHLTSGRLGVNVVTGFQASGAQAMGSNSIRGHGDRYAAAEEYMEVVYKLFEGCWDEGAVIRDRKSGIFADPAKVHKIIHKGSEYDIQGYQLVEPSEQRTPVIYQAGASAKGRAFAGRHAECVFLIEPVLANVRGTVTDLRAQAEKAGRNPHDILIFLGVTVVVAETEAEAKDKYADYNSYINLEAALAYMSGAMGIDLSQFPLDEPIPNIQKDDQIKSLISTYAGEKGKAWTPREIASNTVGGRQTKVIGSPVQVVDELQRMMEVTGIDGFNLSCAVCPGDFEDFVNLVVPEMQRRGIYKKNYKTGTYREKLFGHRHLPASHPASRYRS